MTPFAASLIIGVIIGGLGVLATVALIRRARDDDAATDIGKLRVEVAELHKRVWALANDQDELVSLYCRTASRIDAAEVRLGFLEAQACGRPHVLKGVEMFNGDGEGQGR